MSEANDRDSQARDRANSDTISPQGTCMIEYTDEVLRLDAPIAFMRPVRSFSHRR
jgi:hypothetical protein